MDGLYACFVWKSTKIRYARHPGVVSFADGDRMVITLPDEANVVDWQGRDHVGIQLFFDETSYRLMFEALDRVKQANGNRLAYLRDLFYSHQPAQHLHFDALRFPWLNATQERAVNEVLRAKDVLVVHGPPGTGKTSIG